MRIPLCQWEAGGAPSQFANWFAGACRRGEVEKRKRDKTWNDVAAAQKRGVELQGLSDATRHQLVSTEKGFVDWLELNSDDIVMGPTVEVVKEYAGHIFKFRVRHSSAGREGRSESSNNHVRTPRLREPACVDTCGC